jgi:Recombination endonuclease VII
MSQKGKTKNFVVNGKKICPKCGVNKAVEEYHFSPKKMSSYCKECHRKVTRENWLKTNLTQKSQALVRLCGITLEQRVALFIAQGEKCDICGVSGGDVIWHTDHDHLTKKFRGVLCKFCNHLLGFAKDNPEILRRAAEYLTPSTVVEVL